jgi:hypothetical protein
MLVRKLFRTKVLAAFEGGHGMYWAEGRLASLSAIDAMR